MGYEPKTIGGGPATGLAKNFTDFLNKMITTGSFGGTTSGQQSQNANPMGDAAGIFGLLNSIISNPQADQSIQTLINKDIERGRNDLRSRFGSQGGMAYGTPAAFAESLYQAEQAPRTALALDEMSRQRLASLMPLFGFTRDISSMGIPQAQTVMQPKPWMQALNLGLDVANTAANFIPFGGGGATNTRVPISSTASPSSSFGGSPSNWDWNLPQVKFQPLPIPF